MVSMKHVVITRVSSGLGRAMAIGFAAEGWAVSGCGRDAAALQSLADELGPDHLLQTCDVTGPEAVGDFAAATTERSGTPDLLINNAALINRNAPLWEVPAAEFSRVIDVNLKGVHLVIRAFLPGMIQSGKGVVVNISSGWGRSTSPEVAPYCATKWGIEGLTAALAQELPAGLAAVALNPGIINTRMLRSCFGEGASSCPSPEEWAKAAVPYLASLGTRHNGKALTVPWV
jgi:NAD(P)-dependent dehydrogenase (short-subunit alcohol dehydrogenase family)